MDAVTAAFRNTPPAYLEGCLKMRNPGPGAVGSTFTEPQTAESLQGAAWQPYRHEAVQGPALAFRAPIPGLLGVVELTSLPAGLLVTLADRKGTGFFEVEVPRPEGEAAQAAFTVLLVGPSREDASKTVIWTFFPGAPISPSSLKAADLGVSGPCQRTVAEALALGLVYARVVG